MTKKTQTVKIDEDLTVEFRHDGETKNKVYSACWNFFKKHECFSGESYNQCDSPQLDVANLIDEIMELFEFKEDSEGGCISCGVDPWVQDLEEGECRDCGRKLSED